MVREEIFGQSHYYNLVNTWGVVCMIFVFSNVFPMINRSSQTLVTMADDLDNRMSTSINIVHASASSDRHTVYIWVKNIGKRQ